MIVLRAEFTHLSPLPLTWLSGLVHFNRPLPSPVWMEGHQLKELTVMSAESWLSHGLCFYLVLLASSLGNSILQVPEQKTMQACMNWLSRGHTV